MQIFGLEGLTFGGFRGSFLYGLFRLPDFKAWGFGHQVSAFLAWGECICVLRQGGSDSLDADKARASVDRQIHIALLYFCQSWYNTACGTRTTNGLPLNPTEPLGNSFRPLHWSACIFRACSMG